MTTLARDCVGGCRKLRMLPRVAKGNPAMNRVKNVIIGVFTTYLCFRLLVPQQHVSAWASPYIRACFACLQGGPLRSIVRGLAMYLTLAFAVRLVLYESSFTPTPAGLPKHAQKSHIGSNHQEQLKPIGRPGWLFLVVSPSYWFADTFKQSLCSDRKGRFLQECNWLNIAATLVILILLDVLDSLGLLGGA